LPNPKMCPLKTAAAVVGSMISNNPRPSPSWGVCCDEEHCALWSSIDNGCYLSSGLEALIDALSRGSAESTSDTPRLMREEDKHHDTGR